MCEQCGQGSDPRFMSDFVRRYLKLQETRQAEGVAAPGLDDEVKRTRELLNHLETKTTTDGDRL